MDAETAKVLRGRAKAAFTRTKNFIDKDDQTFDKNDIRNKLEKLELTYTEFDNANAALPIEYSEMEEFETKYYETKAKLQNILENLSVRTYVYNNSDVFENVSNMKSSNFKLTKINIERVSGENCQVRVMTDSGSESAFISEKCLKLLGIKRKNARFQIKGLQDSKITMTKGCVEIDLVSLHNSKIKRSVKAYVLEKLTAPLQTKKNK
ncbi:hypothetical protein TNCV_4605381 [Trichonephila clavipes]|nr:hypothetical protein TNCV_4605381 [Trichonephila clavipes]